jgi:hypothetical protein
MHTCMRLGGYLRPLRRFEIPQLRLLQHRLYRVHSEESTQVSTPTAVETIHRLPCFTQYIPQSPFHLERRMRSELSQPDSNILLTLW